MTSMAPPICSECVHFDVGPVPGTVERTGKCEAFPDGIPDAIWFEGNPHTKPFPGDHGVQFELAPGGVDPTDVNDDD